MRDGLGGEGKDVLSPGLNRLLGLAWVVLFGGRWICVPFLLAAGVLNTSAVADLDDRFLLYCYTLLLTASILVLVLRAMRGGKAIRGVTAAEPEDPTGMSEGARPMAAHEADRRPNVGE
jgi:hypothetical protein